MLTQMQRETGLRERKKQRTRDTIERVALQLFSERGYQETTLADIAEAADVATRTIFAYFPTKEDILFCDFPAMRDALAHALAERPADKDALEAVRDFILSDSHADKDDLHDERDRLVRTDEVLRSHMRARLSQLEELVAAAIAQDLGAGDDDLRPQVVAASLIAAFDVLFERESGKGSARPSPDEIAAVIDPVITFLRGGLEALKRQA
jgi:AcrR family transcriptional regulator